MIWRTGRKVGRTIYEQHGPQPSDSDRLIGLMDTPDLADMVVRALNAAEFPASLAVQGTEKLGGNSPAPAATGNPAAVWPTGCRCHRRTGLRPDQHENDCPLTSATGKAATGERHEAPERPRGSADYDQERPL